MKPFTTIASLFLGLLALVQLIRFVRGWEVIVNGMHVPVWISGVAFLVAGSLAVMLWKESGR